MSLGHVVSVDGCNHKDAFSIYTLKHLFSLFADENFSYWQTAKLN